MKQEIGKFGPQIGDDRARVVDLDHLRKIAQRRGDLRDGIQKIQCKADRGGRAAGKSPLSFSAELNAESDENERGCRRRFERKEKERKQLL